MASAFQASAFQNNAFQIDAVASHTGSISQVLLLSQILAGEKTRTPSAGARVLRIGRLRQEIVFTQALDGQQDERNALALRLLEAFHGELP